MSSNKPGADRAVLPLPLLQGLHGHGRPPCVVFNDRGLFQFQRIHRVVAGQACGRAFDGPTVWPFRDGTLRVARPCSRRAPRHSRNLMRQTPSRLRFSTGNSGKCGSPFWRSGAT
jgi:hypothetical protein